MKPGQVTPPLQSFLLPWFNANHAGLTYRGSAVTVPCGWPVVSYTALRMPTTTSSGIQNGGRRPDFLVQFSCHLRIFQDIQEHFTVCKFTWWNEICSIKIRPINIARILFAVDLDQREPST